VATHGGTAGALIAWPEIEPPGEVVHHSIAVA
jgi:hypothetical protein